jgi:hypothetical protein
MAKGGTTTITLAEAADAIIKNGLPKHKGWQKREGGKVVAACAIAQGARNLGCTYASLSSALRAIKVFDGGSTEKPLNDFIIELNDTTSTEVAEIGALVRARIMALRDFPLTVTLE